MGTKAKLRAKFDFTLSGKQRENFKALLRKLEWFQDEIDETGTTTTTTTTTTNTTNTASTTSNITTTTNNNKGNCEINITGHHMLSLCSHRRKAEYSFSTLANAAHIGVGGQHETPDALHTEKFL